jgi:hypothetical protein
MVDPVTIVVAQRAAERTIIALFAGVSLILGYRLFKLGIIDQQKGEMGWGNLKVKLLSVGPGVFFAMFGTVVFGILAFRPLNIKPGEIVNTAEAKQGAATITYGVDAQKLKLDSISDEDALAITTVVDLLQNRKLTPELNKAQQQSMDRGVKGLVVLRKLAAYERYPKAAPHYEEWSAKSAINDRFIATLDEQDRKEFLAMRDFLKNSYLSEANP